MKKLLKFISYIISYIILHICALVQKLVSTIMRQFEQPAFMLTLLPVPVFSRKYGAADMLERSGTSIFYGGSNTILPCRMQTTRLRRAKENLFWAYFVMFTAFCVPTIFSLSNINKSIGYFTQFAYIIAAVIFLAGFHIIFCEKGQKRDRCSHKNCESGSCMANKTSSNRRLVWLFFLTLLVSFFLALNLYPFLFNNKYSLYDYWFYILFTAFAASLFLFVYFCAYRNNIYDIKEAGFRVNVNRVKRLGNLVAFPYFLFSAALILAYRFSYSTELPKQHFFQIIIVSVFLYVPVIVVLFRSIAKRLVSILRFFTIVKNIRRFKIIQIIIFFLLFVPSIFFYFFYIDRIVLFIQLEQRFAHYFGSIIVSLCITLTVVGLHKWAFFRTQYVCRERAEYKYYLWPNGQRLWYWAFGLLVFLPIFFHNPYLYIIFLILTTMIIPWFTFSVFRMNPALDSVWLQDTLSDKFYDKYLAGVAGIEPVSTPLAKWWPVKCLPFHFFRRHASWSGFFSQSYFFTRLALLERLAVPRQTGKIFAKIRILAAWMKLWGFAPIVTFIILLLAAFILGFEIVGDNNSNLKILFAIAGGIWFVLSLFFGLRIGTQFDKLFQKEYSNFFKSPALLRIWFHDNVTKHINHFDSKSVINRYFLMINALFTLIYLILLQIIF